MEEQKKVRRVDFFLHKEDFEAAYLGSLGFSTKYIESRTNLSSRKITYRLRNAQVRRADYRDGEGPSNISVVGCVILPF